MDYEKIYTEFYTKYYDKAEFLIQQFFVKRHQQNQLFLNVLNEVNQFLYAYPIQKCVVSKNENLNKLHVIFGNRYRIYANNPIQHVLQHEIKTGFDQLNPSELPNNYHYSVFVKEMALVEAVNEISRVLSNNARLLEMMYQLNQLGSFEIRIQENLALEEYPIYKKLRSKLYSDTQNSDLGLSGNQIVIQSDFENAEKQYKHHSLFINPKVYDCFLEYQKFILDFYADYSYLKKRLEAEKLIHYHKDNSFMKLVYEEMKLISEKNYHEYCIQGKLKSLEKSYNVHRNNNFNIVFDSVL
jgi:hypothetical protein